MLMRERFKKIREDKGKSQAQFSVDVDISLSTISGFESGRVRDLSPRIRLKLAEAYGVPIEEINDACGAEVPA